MRVSRTQSIAASLSRSLIRLLPGAMLSGVLAATPAAQAAPLLYASAQTCSGLGDIGLCGSQSFVLDPPAQVADAQKMLNVVEDFGPPFGAGSLDAQAQATARYGQASASLTSSMSEYLLGKFVASDIISGPAAATASFQDLLLAIAGAGELRVRFAVGSAGFSALPGVEVSGSYYLGLGSQVFEDALGAPQVFTSAWVPISAGTPVALTGLARVDTLVNNRQPPRDYGTGMLEFGGQLLVLGLDIRSADGSLAIEAASGTRYDIQVLAVPEPGSAVLMLLGVALLLAYARRRAPASTMRFVACSHSGESH